MDNLVLNGPQGASLNVGSYLRAEPGPDFGSKDLQKALFAENAYTDQPALALESVGPRRMSFPLFVPSGYQRVLRQIAREGATLDVQVDGIASADAVRFDVLSGRLEDDYSLPIRRGARLLPAVLKLDTQPYAYLPTTILLASSASVGLPGQLAIPAGSIIGDLPGLADLIVRPASPATSFGGGATWWPDLLVWSLGARPSFSAFIGPSSLLPVLDGSATIVQDAFSPASVAWQFDPIAPTALGAWTRVAHWQIPTGLEPAYAGRFRALALARLSVATHYLQVSLDAVPARNFDGALASAQPIATLAHDTIAGGSGAGQLLDLGEVTLPPLGASGSLELPHLRLWAKAGTTSVGTTPRLLLEGIYLQPLDGAVGFLPRGLAVPSSGNPQPGQFILDGIRGRQVLARPQVPPPVASYRQMIASGGAIAHWRLGDIGAIAKDEIAGRNGLYRGVPSRIPGALPDDGDGAIGLTRAQAAMLASAWVDVPHDAAFNLLGDLTIEAWIAPNSVASFPELIAKLGEASNNGAATQHGFFVGIDSPNGGLYFRQGASGVAAVTITGSVVSLPQWQHVAAVRRGATISLFINGTAAGVGPGVVGTPAFNSKPLFFGYRSSGIWGYDGAIDEVAIYPSALSTQTVATHYLVGINSAFSPDPRDLRTRQRWATTSPRRLPSCLGELRPARPDGRGAQGRRDRLPLPQRAAPPRRRVAQLPPRFRFLKGL
jgi:hypothetical protein